ncbi:hypothetical protein JX265_013193 [Neoarthrinium moseri]|uniref:Uncharacterized protein n=1 Tax=Neoarthrinium moseri TaxID=1658444 RepID=A0A9P9W993_9PEZI|nr:hypothetical protein JX265_013193 [Neoarthrinium moseri]
MSNFSALLLPVLWSAADALVDVGLDMVRNWWKTGKVNIAVKHVLTKVLTAIAGRVAQLLTPIILGRIKTVYTATPSLTVTLTSDNFAALQDSPSIRSTAPDRVIKPSSQLRWSDPARSHVDKRRTLPPTQCSVPAVSYSDGVPILNNCGHLLCAYMHSWFGLTIHSVVIA